VLEDQLLQIHPMLWCTKRRSGMNQMTDTDAYKAYEIHGLRNATAIPAA
jgi:hypothetical protein